MLADGMNDLSLLDANLSNGYYLDPWGVLTPNRPDQGTYGWFDFTGVGLTPFTQVIDQTGGAISSGNFGVQLTSQCHIVNTLPILPAQYGVMLSINANAGAQQPNSFVLKIQNSVDNSILMLYGGDGGLSVFDSSTNTNLLLTDNAGGSWGQAESWIEVSPSSNGKTTIVLFQGTKLITTQIVALPIGDPATAGVVQLQNLTDSSASQVYALRIGKTQLWSALDLTWQPKQPTSTMGNYKAVNLLAAIGDISLSLIPNTNLIASVRPQDGISGWGKVTLYELEWPEALPSRRSIIDNIKPLRLFAGTATGFECAWPMRMRWQVAGGAIDGSGAFTDWQLAHMAFDPQAIT